LVSSFVAMIFLSMGIPKIGGSFGKMLKLLISGIFLAVFAHAGFELLGAYGVINEEFLMKIMGLLLSLGSVCFIVAGYVGLKALK